MSELGTHLLDDPSRRTPPADRKDQASKVTMADLPPPGTTRWVISRKAAVVAGVKIGLLSLDEALNRYGLSLDEFLSWKRLLDDFGVKGLRVTRIKEYRASGTSDDTHPENGGPAATPCAA